jgi:thioredoxin 1
MSVAVTELTFDETLAQDTPVLVDFWAEWCGPCKTVAPILDKLVDEANGAVTLAKVNIDEQQELARRFSVMSIPTMILFKNGEIVERIVGARPLSDLQKVFAPHLS